MIASCSLPASLCAFAAQIERDAGHPVTAVALAASRWTLVCDSGTIRLEISYKCYSRGRCRATSSSVYRDGRRIPRSELDYDSTMWLLRDPETRGVDTPPLDLDAPTRPIADLDQVPSCIREDVSNIRRRLRSVGGFNGVEVENGRSRWVIVTTFDNGLTFRLTMHVRLDWEALEETAFAPADRPVEVFRDGVDVTGSTDPYIQGLVGILTGAGHINPAVPGNPGVAQEAGAARSNSVEVRRASVIRT
jgi:hypothetical protein